MLLDRGADVSAKDESGKTARSLLEKKLSGKGYAPGGYNYERGNREKAERLVQRMMELEQIASAASANEP